MVVIQNSIKRISDYYKSLGIWIQRVGYSLADQALFSGSNFLLNILLVRWLGTEKYGAFSLGFTVFLVGSSFYNGFLLEPVSVLGVHHLGSTFRSYSNKLLIVHFLSTAIFSAFICVIAFSFQRTQPIIENSLVGVAISLPFMLFYWLYRQLCYLQSRPNIAFAGSFLYASLLIMLIVVFHKFNLLSPLNSFLIMGASSAASAFILWSTATKPLVNSKYIIEDTRNILKENFNYGKWVLLTSIFYCISTFLYPPLIAIFISLNDVGLLRAMQNLFQPLQQVLVALSLLFLPLLVRKKTKSGPLSIVKSVNQFGGVSLFISAAYLIILLLFGGTLLEFIYSSNEFVSGLWVLPYLGIITIMTTIYTMIVMALRALERPNIVFYANAASAIFTITVGYFLVKQYGFRGAITSMTISSFVLMLAVFFQYLVLIRKIEKKKLYY